MAKILDFISSKEFRNRLLFVLFTVLMAVTISSQNYLFQKVIKNGVFTADISAKRDMKVVDVVKTEQLKKKAMQSVQPILTQVEDESITTNLSNLHNYVLKIRNKDVSYREKTAELRLLFGESDTQMLSEYMLKANENDLNHMFDKAQITLNTVLNNGISSMDFENDNVTNIIRKNLPQNVSRLQGNVIIDILKQVIVPNLVIDDDATNIAKKNAADAVKPFEVLFKKGQNIVIEGERVNTLKLDALRNAGYNILTVNWMGILGVYILVAFFTFIFLQYERNYEKQYYNSKYMTIMGIFTLLLAFVSALLPTGFSPYIIPIPAYTIILSIFTTSRNAFFASTIVTAIIAIGMHWSLEVIAVFALLNTVVITALSRLKFSKRSDLLVVSTKISLSSILILGGVYLLEKLMMDIDNAFILEDLGFMLINTFVISGVFILGFLPIIENIFKVMTPYGLAELADHNQELLKRLMQEAPGTFNHSLTVSHMCETAAEAIGADPVLARVGAMYHDIGKLQRPMFFVENQSFYGIENPHNSCAPSFSKMLITAHPKDGLELAKDYHIPQVIYSFIMQHHGTSLVSYFYNEAIKEKGAENVKEDQFRYPGPKPNTKETAILMIADAVESAVRAAKNPTNEQIDAIIDKIIKERLNDGQLDDSPLTLKDITAIGETFSRMLRGMHHKRIKYHDDLVQEFSKNKNNMKDLIPQPIVAKPSLDKDLEAKINELEIKRTDNTKE